MFFLRWPAVSRGHHSPNLGRCFSVFSSSGTAKTLVSNLPPQTRLEDLDQFFSSYGQVQHIEKVPTRDSNTQTVIVSYETQDQAQQWVSRRLLSLRARARARDRSIDRSRWLIIRDGEVDASRGGTFIRRERSRTFAGRAHRCVNLREPFNAETRIDSRDLNLVSLGMPVLIVVAGSVSHLTRSGLCTWS